MKTDFIQIASYASKAPSGHNTQPWKFHITDSTITVLPNLDVALPVVDRNNRELFISLGCAVENLCIAASYFGYTTHIIECSICLLYTSIQSIVHLYHFHISYSFDEKHRFDLRF